MTRYQQNPAPQNPASPTTERPTIAQPATEQEALRVTPTLEIELKFEVPDDTEYPDDSLFAAAGFVVDAPVTHRLNAAYFDTPDRRLAARRVAVRRRSGGTDDGWHIKAHATGEGVTGTEEYQWPLSDEAPDELLSVLEELVGDVRGVLEPLASLNTVRTVRELRDAAGARVIELADDQVRAVDHRTETPRAWREWEAELSEGADPALLALVSPVLENAGAVPSLSIAKVARASGQLVDFAVETGLEAEDLATVVLVDLADRIAAGSGLDPRAAGLRRLARQLQIDQRGTSQTT